LINKVSANKITFMCKRCKLQQLYTEQIFISLQTFKILKLKCIFVRKQHSHKPEIVTKKSHNKNQTTKFGPEMCGRRHFGFRVRRFCVHVRTCLWMGCGAWMLNIQVQISGEGRMSDSSQHHVAVADEV